MTKEENKTIITETKVKVVEKIKKKPVLLSLTKNKGTLDTYFRIMIDNDNKCFICTTEGREGVSNPISYPFGKDKVESLSTILGHYDFYCYSLHKIYPKNGEFSELYK